MGLVGMFTEFSLVEAELIAYGRLNLTGLWLFLELQKQDDSETYSSFIWINRGKKSFDALNL